MPIRRVVARESDRAAKTPGGGAAKVFEEGADGPQLLQDLAELESDLQDLATAFPTVPPVLRVQLKYAALAKSHRPTTLFDEEAPIIGIAGPGELLVVGGPQSISTIRRRMANPTSVALRANISAIEHISLLEPESKLHFPGTSDENNQMISLKVKLFDYHDQGVNDETLRRFLQFLHDRKLSEPTVFQYAPELRVLGLDVPNQATAKDIASFPGVRTAGAFPMLSHGINVTAIDLGAMPAGRLPLPTPGVDYPVVGVFDAGTDPTNLPLGAWRLDRFEYLPAARDFSHGSFVAGLVVSSKSLNGSRPDFPAVNSKFLDIVMMPIRGVHISETQILATIDAALARYPDVRIWNLSIGYPYPADPDEFSDLARAMDARQDKHNVQFIVAAGNYTDPPLRAWPSTITSGSDRISSPGDSARALTVGSVAHLDNGISAVKAGEPSPFSRRGPGPSFVPKPEIHHHGGNCSVGGDCHQIGVQSVGAAGNLTEDVGTSFATPIVSSIVANLDQALGGGYSRNTLKALTIHSALLNADPNVSAGDLNYFGFGKPGDVVDMLACDPWSFTFLYEPELVAGYTYSIWPFPLPATLLRDGKLYGEVLITLVYDPPLDRSYGFEYCRSNVELSFGTYLLDESGKRHQSGKIPVEAIGTAGLEAHLIEHGFKWSPTKVYRKRFAGTSGDVWRLSAELLHRSGFAAVDPQKATILLTLRDPDEENTAIYSETLEALRASGRAENALRVKDQLRYRRRGQ